MFDFIMDFIVDPLLELSLCHFNFTIWGKHRVKSFLLSIPVIIFLYLLVIGIRDGSWPAALVGLPGLLYFGYQDIKYEVWWIREGRFGTENPSGEEMPIPKGDIMSKLSEEEQLRGKLEDSHRCLNNRM